MRAIAVLLLTIIIAWSLFTPSAASGSEPEEKQPSSSGSVWQDVKDDCIEIGKGARDAGVEVGKSFKKEFQELPENMRKGYQETKEALTGGSDSNTKDTSPDQSSSQ